MKRFPPPTPPSHSQRPVVHHTGRTIGQRAQRPPSPLALANAAAHLPRLASQGGGVFDTGGTERTSGPAEAFIPSAHPAEPPQSLLLATPIQFKAAGATFDALKVLEPIQSGGSEKVRLVGRVALDPPPEPSPSPSAPGLHTHSTPPGRSSSRHQALGERGHPPFVAPDTDSLNPRV